MNSPLEVWMLKPGCEQVNVAPVQPTPAHPPLKRVPDLTNPSKTKLVPSLYGSEWYGELGVPQASLKKGDRIYVALPIKNRHRLAYYLAIKHSKQEIAKLYTAANGIKVGSFDLRDVFKMDATQLAANGIDYTQLFSKQ